MTMILLLVITSIILYFLVARRNYWSRKNVQCVNSYASLRENLKMMLGKQSFPETIQNMYNNVPNVRYMGCYMMQTPFLIIKSPELIKQLCVRDFDHFLDHRRFFPDKVDELWSKNLLALTGQNWKNMRSALSPSFTSSKMKSMFVLICDNAKTFVQYFTKNNETLIEVEFKDAYTRYTTDVIASTSFGLKVDSLENRKNEFFMMGNDITNMSDPWNKFVVTLYTVCPAFAGFLRIPFFRSNVKSFFVNLVKDTIKMRKEQNIKRPDMLGLLMEARNGQVNERSVDEIKTESFAAVEEHLTIKNIRQDLTDADIASQVFIFFLGGFDTVSSGMCFMAYELAVNPDVQTKLIEEIDENRPPEGSPSYEAIANMVYLDMVVSETLRKWPIMPSTDRVVTKPYTIEPEHPGEKPVHLGNDTNIMIPIFCIHRDSKYYENPEMFDPERFAPENRKNINPYTFLPFGVGQRNCIGSRFALLEIKAVFFYLLSHFEIIPVEKTDIPLKISKSSFNLLSENKFPLGLRRRNNSIIQNQ